MLQPSCWALRKAPAMTRLERLRHRSRPHSALTNRQERRDLYCLAEVGSLLLAPAPGWLCLNCNHSGGNQWPPVPCLVVAVASAFLRGQEHELSSHREVKQPSHPAGRDFTSGQFWARAGEVADLHQAFILPLQTTRVSRAGWLQPSAYLA